MDLSCFDDLDESASETDDEMLLLEQDLYHRLLEDYGSNPDDADRGVGIMSLISGSFDAVTIGRKIEADFSKDDRVLSCEAVVTVSQTGNDGVIANIEITVGTSDGALKLGYVTTGDDNELTGGVIQ